MNQGKRSNNSRIIVVVVGAMLVAMVAFLLIFWKIDFQETSLFLRYGSWCLYGLFAIFFLFLLTYNKKS